MILTGCIGGLKKMSNQSCKTCIYFRQLYTNPITRGYCRRYPPIVVKGGGTYTRESTEVPVVEATMWCGEYKTND